MRLQRLLRPSLSALLPLRRFSNRGGSGIWNSAHLGAECSTAGSYQTEFRQLFHRDGSHRSRGRFVSHYAQPGGSSQTGGSDAGIWDDCGFIVGTSLKVDRATHNPVGPARVRALAGRIR